jgi:cystathionine gamma-lyase
MHEGTLREGTRVVRAGLPEPAQGDPFLPGPTFAGTYHFRGEVGDAAHTYGRYSNPTWTRFEQALGELEGGEAVVFSSGMAAVAALLGTVLHPGDILVMPSDGYYTARLLAEGHFRELGVELRLAPTAGDAQGEHLAGTALLWLETPSNPGLDVCDIAALAAAAHDQGALVAVDNTLAAVIGQYPLALGAEFAVASDTKGLTGHSDLVLGHVAARDPAWAERLRQRRTQWGAVPGPMEVWMAHRSLATLELRQERQCANALAIAQLLATRRDVQGLRYPGLPGDPAHAVAARQMRRFGSIVGFALANRSHAERFLAACRLVVEATSFGGVQTTAERRARWGSDAVPEGFIRLSVGCEDAADLFDDLAQALDAAQ